MARATRLTIAHCHRADGGKNILDVFWKSEIRPKTSEICPKIFEIRPKASENARNLSENFRNPSENVRKRPDAGRGIVDVGVDVNVDVVFGVDGDDDVNVLAMMKSTKYHFHKLGGCESK